jgi:hypothetical protein
MRLAASHCENVVEKRTTRLFSHAMPHIAQMIILYDVPERPDVVG